MKYRFLSVVVLLDLILSGCATFLHSAGKDFPNENVTEISKGETTSVELIKLFGEPFIKTVLTATDEKWIYTYSNGEAKVKSYIVTMSVKTTSSKKTLEVLISSGVVANFTYIEGKDPQGFSLN